MQKIDNLRPGTAHPGPGPVAPIRLFILAEVRLYREGLELILGREDTFRVVGGAPSLGPAMPLIRRSRPDIVLLDLASEGLTVARTLRLELPETKLVALAIREVDDEVIAWAEAGMAGYVSRQASLTDLSATIRRAAVGELVCPPQITANLVRHLSDMATRRPAADGLAQLTTREMDVVRLVGCGLSNKEIARELSIALPTVKNHVHSILEKLQVHRRGDAASMMREGTWQPQAAAQ
jgi:two-component system nitrate/nitrite response regulator NarL